MSRENVENKLQTLEDLLQTWHKENQYNEKQSFEKIKKLMISVCCILVGAVGALWSFVELSDWYLKQKAISDMAANYILIANENYARTRDAQTGMNMAAKAVELTPNDPDVRFYYAYYRSQKTQQDFLQITRPLTGEEIGTLNETFSELDVLKRLAPDRWEPYMLEATILRRVKQYKKAENAIKNAIRLEKEYTPEIHYWHYMIVMSLKKYDEGEKIVTELIKKCPEDKWALLGLARWKLRKRQYQECKELCKKAMTKDPNFYDAQLLLGVAYTYLKDNRTAINCNQKAITMRPTACAACYNNIASQFRNQNKLSTALAYAEKGIELFPGYVQMRLQKILILLDMGSYENINEEIAQFMKMAPDDVRPYRLDVSACIANRNFKKAKEASMRYQEFMDLKKNNDESEYNSLALFFLRLGINLKEAIPYSKKSMEKNPRSDRLFTLANIYFDLRDEKAFAETADNLIKACKNDIDRVELSSRLAALQLQWGRTNEALKLIQYAEKIIPDNLYLLQAKVQYYTHIKDFVQAGKFVRKMSKKAVRVSDLSNSNYIQAQFHAAKGEYQIACEYMAKTERHLNSEMLKIQPFFFDYAEYLIKCARYQEAKEKLDMLRPICNDMKRYDELMHLIRQKKQ